MSLLFIDSFDHYDEYDSVNQVTSKWTANPLGTAEIRAGEGRCNTAAMRCSGNTGTLSKGIPGITTAGGVVGYALKPDETAVGLTVLKILDWAGIQFQLGWSKFDGSIYLIDGSGANGGSSAADVIRQFDYYYVECKFTIGAAGTVVVRVNGTTVLDLSGVDTNGSATASWSAVGFDNGQNAIYYVDDLYVCDLADGTATQGRPNNDFLGDCHVDRLRPVAVGAVQEWDVTGAGGIAHDAVDDDAAFDGDDSYISTATVNESALFQFSDPLTPTDVVFGIQVNLLAQKEVPGVRAVAPLVRIGGTTTTGTGQNPSQSNYTDLHQLFGQNPTTSAPWTPANLASGVLEVGVKLTV